MWTINDIINYIESQKDCCFCPAYLFDSEYVCPFCFNYEVHMLCLKLAENEYL